jgi:hypothetical protein
MILPEPKAKNSKISMRKISLNEKLILYFLFLGLGAIFIIGFYSFSSTREALMDRTFDQLTSLRIAKKNQTEIFFQDRIKEVRLLSESEDTREIAAMAATLPGKKCMDAMAGYLEKYQPLTGYFTSIKIVTVNGRYLKGFTTDHRVETGTTGPGRPTPLTASVIRDESADPATGNARMFFEAPVFSSGSQSAGILILELPAGEINAIMLNNDPMSGLGMTGETYLVGKDLKMRSASRFISGSILRTTVSTSAMMNAIRSGEGHTITRDYRSIMVLSSYSKLNIPGLEWFILAEIDQREAMVPIYRMRNSILLLSILISVIFFVFVFMISRRPP